ncbi:MAG: hypothetical protein FH749_08340 [Firmicutes bacterium]|nr:hypothetical protein [Bacillota bacterium]
MKIRNIYIQQYGPLQNIHITPSPGLQVISGRNESGKTLTIDAVLKLLLGAKLRDFENIDRVANLPRGHVTCADQNGNHTFDGQHLLSKALNINVRDMRNLFVIRNKDLSLTAGAEYLRSLSDRLTGMETTRIQRLRILLQNQGRLTNATATAQLSKSQEHGKLGERKQKAAALVAEIDAYIKTARQDQRDALELKLDALQQQLTILNQKIEQQNQARAWNQYKQWQHLRRQQEQYAAMLHDLAQFTNEEYKEIMALDVSASNFRQTAAGFQQELNDLRTRAADLDHPLADAQARLQPLQDRQPLVDNLRQQIRQMPAPVDLPLLPLYLLLAASIAGLALSATGTITGWLTALPLLSGIAATTMLIAYSFRLRKNQRIFSLYQQAAELGLAADTPKQLAAALADRQSTLETVQQTVANIEEKQRRLKADAQSLLSRIQQQLTQAATAESRRDKLLNKHGISDLSEYMQKLANQKELRVQLRQTQKQLAELGTPTPTVDPGIHFDQQRLTADLERKDEITAALTAAREQLHAHNQVLQDFAVRCQQINVAEYASSPLPSHFTNLSMLNYGKEVLTEFCREVETNSQAALTAIAILEKIEAEETARAADLFAQQKPVHDLFNRFTAKRYCQISADRQLNLSVSRPDGTWLSADKLSQGTLDQLYMAVRIALAGQLPQPRFLLLDDPFLCVDSERLQSMLAALSELAQNHWQILYFTIDERVLASAKRFSNNQPIELQQLI